MIIIVCILTCPRRVSPFGQKTMFLGSNPCLEPSRYTGTSPTKSYVVGIAVREQLANTIPLGSQSQASESCSRTVREQFAKSTYPVRTLRILLLFDVFPRFEGIFMHDK